MARARSYTTQELRALTEAGIGLTTELALDSVLQKVVELARELIRTHYAAISVLGRDGAIERFLFSGISEARRQKIGNLPKGEGLLGVILREGASLRLEDMSADTRSVGFPPNHPPMKSLLGVPVTSQGRIIGKLYLTEKEGGAPFSDSDEELLRLLAAQAAVAIHNAELYEAQQRYAGEWKALFEMGREVTASPDLQSLLDSAVVRARKLLKADAAALMLLRGHEMLEIAAHDGLQSNLTKKSRPLSDHTLQRLALTNMSRVVVVDAPSDERLRDQHAAWVAEEALVSLICVPLRGKGGPLGTITVGNRQPSTFDESDAELVEALANWAAIAIETSGLYDRLEGLARLEERDRIAMDLHDGVMQTIYAVGLHLEDCAERLQETPQEAKPVLEKAIDDLHQVIKDIRSYIFDLRPRVSQVADLPEALHQLVEEVRVNTLIDARAEIGEQFDGLVNDDQALALFHIAQEALNNVTKHSKASSARLKLDANDGQVTLEIRDNGAGFAMKEEGFSETHGMRNMRDRARSLGASLFVDSEPGQGTVIRIELAVSNQGGRANA